MSSASSSKRSVSFEWTLNLTSVSLLRICANNRARAPSTLFVHLLARKLLRRLVLLFPILLLGFEVLLQLRHMLMNTLSPESIFHLRPPEREVNITVPIEQVALKYSCHSISPPKRLSRQPVLLHLRFLFVDILILQLLDMFFQS